MAHSRSTSTRASSRLPQQAQKLPDHVVQRLKSMCSKDPFNCIVAVKRVQLPWRCKLTSCDGVCSNPRYFFPIYCLAHASPSVCDNSRSAIPLSSSSDPIHLAVYKNYPRKISKYVHHMSYAYFLLYCALLIVFQRRRDHFLVLPPPYSLPILNLLVANHIALLQSNL